MIQIAKNEVLDYLQLVHDKNPIHQQLVPGQMVVEIAKLSLNISWTNYKIKYVEPVEINEFIQFDLVEVGHVIVSNSDERVKIHILKI
ncbi:hypothetical protein [Staphylococcus gallinarum]|uniref:hypothetical protein n=1 Tax=Staphylococcus gallinarum TaxID=1293 RepID=UPI000D1C88F4|nr:hypothetical protein [Staphylococcus gallinarum]MBU7217899.1 hypothetical protein [Staphylococcus gallinarum]MCD8793952.1 hypothetical protein [Staphylococcus gallinarum]PTE32062.1 hypothetical protein BUZ00_12350 [Staphylococcus gallinarum]PTK91775.1 hypothetical protein BUZ03_04465 [Staphylococcus gallinarum]RIL21666.1 hypothetical protein BUY99_08370 [Staphylococcus gallinarum]